MRGTLTVEEAYRVLATGEIKKMVRKRRLPYSVLSILRVSPLFLFIPLSDLATLIEWMRACATSASSDC